jgi:hypothetical protein
MKKLNIFVLIIILFSELSVYGQLNISGKIVDKDNKPVEYAAILIKKDSALVTTTISDSLGNYKFTLEKPSKYFFIVSAPNFQQQNTVISFTKDTIINTVLQNETQNIEEVIVTANKTTLERKADRFVYNVGNREATKGSTIFEVLKQAPLINSIGDNSLSIPGKTNTEIYINGRKSNIPPEALINLMKNTGAGNLIRIEIITMPASNFDVKGNTGIINIVLKKDLTDGTNVFMRIADYQAYYNNQTGNLNINYRSGKIGVSVNSFVNETKQMYLTNSEFQFADNNSVQSIETTDKQPKLNYGINAGIDYNINAKHTVSFKVNAYSVDKKNNIAESTDKYSVLNSAMVDSTQKVQNFESGNLYNINCNANYHFDINEGSYLDADFNYLTYNDKKDNEYLGFSNSGNLTKQFTQQVLQNIENYSAKIEYQRTLNQSNILDIGTDLYITQNNNKTRLADYIGNEYVNNITGSYNYKYEEQIACVFANYTRKWNEKLQTVLGTRFENATNKGKIETKNQLFSNNYQNILPYLSISYALSENHLFSYTFSNRIERPAFWELNPYRFYITSTQYMENNPYLKPKNEYINELTYTLNKKYTFLLNYTKTFNDFEQIQIKNVNSDTVKYVRLNYGNSQNLSLTTALQNSFLKDRLETNFSVTGGFLSYNGTADYIKNNQTSPFFMININTTYTVPHIEKMFVFVDFRYNYSSYTFSGFVKPSNDLSGGFKKRWGNITALIWFSDIFKNSGFTLISENDNFKSHVNYYSDSRNIYFAITYSFGNKNLKTNRQRNDSNQDILNRTQK